eukprot:10216404-Karenia_brevis.AAC.1
MGFAGCLSTQYLARYKLGAGKTVPGIIPSQPAGGLNCRQSAWRLIGTVRDQLECSHVAI